MKIELIIESVAINTIVNPDRDKLIQDVLSIEENMCSMIASKAILEATDDVNAQQSKLDKVVSAIKEVLKSVWKSITDFYIKHADVAGRLYSRRKDIELGYNNIKDDTSTLDIKKYNIKSGMADKIYDICEDAVKLNSNADGEVTNEGMAKAKKTVYHKLAMEGITDDNILEPQEVSKYGAIKLSDILETLKNAEVDRRCMEKAFSGIQKVNISLSGNTINYTVYRNKISLAGDVLNKYSKQVVAKIAANCKLANHCIKAAK